MFKILCVNSFIIGRIMQWEDVLKEKETFVSLYYHGHTLNIVQSLVDYTCTFAVNVLEYSDILYEQGREDAEELLSEEKQAVHENEVKRLVLAARQRKRYRLQFVNSADGIILHTIVKNHRHTSSGVWHYCAICGMHKGILRGRRSLIQFQQCFVLFSVMKLEGYRHICWHSWHN